LFPPGRHGFGGSHRTCGLYTSLDRAAEALVRDNRPTAHVVELDTPGGVVVREWMLTE